VLGVPHKRRLPFRSDRSLKLFRAGSSAAIALFGFQSGAALATVVGVLVEVPVMLTVVRLVLRSRPNLITL